MAEENTTSKPQNFKNGQSLTFMNKIQRINDILIKILIARISPVSTDFDIKSMIHSIVEITKYQAFKTLVRQTGEVIEARTTHQPELLAKLAEHSTDANSDIFIFKSDQNNKISVDESSKSELAENLFDNGLRIMMYDKIVKSGFSHLSIFIDDFNFIYNEVIDCSNNMNHPGGILYPLGRNLKALHNTNSVKQEGGKNDQ